MAALKKFSYDPIYFNKNADAEKLLFITKGAGGFEPNCLEK